MSAHRTFVLRLLRSSSPAQLSASARSVAYMLVVPVKRWSLTARHRGYRGGGVNTTLERDAGVEGRGGERERLG